MGWALPFPRTGGVLDAPVKRIGAPEVVKRGGSRVPAFQAAQLTSRPPVARSPAACLDLKVSPRSIPGRPLPEAQVAYEMSKQDAIELEGTVTELLPNATFRVTVQTGHEVLTTLAGNMRRNRIRVLAGDRVTVEVSPYDLTRGRITFRHKN